MSVFGGLDLPNLIVVSVDPSPSLRPSLLPQAFILHKYRKIGMMIRYRDSEV